VAIIDYCHLDFGYGIVLNEFVSLRIHESMIVGIVTGQGVEVGGELIYSSRH